MSLGDDRWRQFGVVPRALDPARPRSRDPHPADVRRRSFASGEGGAVRRVDVAIKPRDGGPTYRNCHQHVWLTSSVWTEGLDIVLDSDSTSCVSIRRRKLWISTRAWQRREREGETYVRTFTATDSGPRRSRPYVKRRSSTSLPLPRSTLARSELRRRRRHPSSSCRPTGISCSRWASRRRK